MKKLLLLLLCLAGIQKIQGQTVDFTFVPNPPAQGQNILFTGTPNVPTHTYQWIFENFYDDQPILEYYTDTIETDTNSIYLSFPESGIKTVTLRVLSIDRTEIGSVTKSVSVTQKFLNCAFGGGDPCNLVCNGSFENYAFAGSDPSTWIPNAWNNTAQQLDGWVNHGTSDSYSSLYPIPTVTASNCDQGTQVQRTPENLGGFQYPVSGNAYAGIVAYSDHPQSPPLPFGPNYREYISSKLTSPMVPGNTYYVRFYVSLAEKFKYGVSDLGISFFSHSGGPFSNGIDYDDSSTGNGSYDVSVNGTVLSADIASPAGVPLIDTMNWIPIEGFYTPNSVKTDFIIGRFKRSDQVNVVVTPPLGSASPGASSFCWSHAYYYVDDVSVSPFDINVSDAGCGYELSLSCPLPSGYSVQWNGPAGTIECETCPSTQVYPFGSTGVNVSYVANIVDSNGQVVASVSTSVPSLPVPSPTIPAPEIIGSVEICCTENNIYTIGANFGNYLWVVDGGVVTSGQGTNQVTVSWNDPSAGGSITVIMDNGGDACVVSQLIIEPCCELRPYSVFLNDINPSGGDIGPDDDGTITWGGSDYTIYEETDACEPTLASQWMDDNGNLYGSQISTGGSGTSYIVINNDLIIDVDFTFLSSKFSIAPDRKIVVRPGVKLTILGSTLAPKCDRMWEGIVLEDNTSELEMRGTIIGAKAGVRSIDGALFEIRNSNFLDNYVGVVMDPHSGTHLGTIRGSFFTILNSNLLAPYANLTRPEVGVLVKGVTQATIGEPLVSQVNPETNVFFEHHYAILSNQSNLNVIDNEFYFTKDPSGLPNNNNYYAILATGSNTQHYQLTVGGTNNTLRNLFYDNNIGVRADRNVNVDIRRNDFEQIVANGVRVTQNTSGTINIRRNDVLSTTGLIGFYALDNNQCDIDIVNNNINWALGGNPDALLVGIAIQNVLPLNFSNNNTGLVRNNRIKNTNLGIFVGNNPITQVNQNTIRIQKSNAQLDNPNSPFGHEGIRVVFSAGTRVFNNFVFRSGGDPNVSFEQDLRGILVENSAFTPTFNNRLNRMGNGITYRGSNISSFISCNRMWRNYKGMRFGNPSETIGTDIGNQGINAGVIPQYPNGITWDNRWFSNLSGERSDGLLNTLTDIYRKPQGVFNSIPSLDLNLSGFDQITLSNQSFSNCSGPIGPGGGTTPGPVRRALIFGPIVYNQKSFEQLGQEFNWYDRFLTYNMFRFDNAWLSQDPSTDADFQQFQADCGGSNMERIANTVEAYNVHDNALASNQIASINPICIQEDYMKQVLTIYDSTFADSVYTFTPQQQADLEFIACLDPTEKGPAVYSARAMLGLFFGCSNGVMRSANANEDSTIEQVSISSLYPNPNNGNFTLEYELEQQGMFGVYDLTGKLVHTQRLSSGFNILEMNLENLDNGVYVYRILSGERIITTSRFVVTK